MSRQKIKIGSVVKIALKNGKYGYAQILDRASYAFFNYFTKDEKDDVEVILSSEVLFILSAYDDIATKGRWKK